MQDRSPTGRDCPLLYVTQHGHYLIFFFFFHLCMYFIMVTCWIGVDIIVDSWLRNCPACPGVRNRGAGGGYERSEHDRFWFFFKRTCSGHTCRHGTDVCSLWVFRFRI